MASLKDYFDRVCYKAVHEIGDRVRGNFDGVPFTGTVGNDTLISEEEGPYVTVHTDLPTKIDGVYRSILKVKHTDIKSSKESLLLEKSKTVRKKKT